MKVLNRAKSFGRISPPMEVGGCDMHACYEQDGVLFDAHDYPCVPGAKETIDAEAKSETAVAKIDTATEAVDPAPTPRQKRATQRAAAQPSKTRDTPDPIRAAEPPANGIVDGIDLAAWGRGKTDYLFGEVRKAVKKAYGAQLTERRDVVDLLIAQRVIAASEARADV